MQRDLGVLDVQYYNDPVKSMQQGYSRSDINEKTDKIEAKKKTIEADQQAITDAEEELQRAGGDPGWAR
jgi:chaperonin cofactor prefoldin